MPVVPESVAICPIAVNTVARDNVAKTIATIVEARVGHLLLGARPINVGCIGGRIGPASFEAQYDDEAGSVQDLASLSAYGPAFASGVVLPSDTESLDAFHRCWKFVEETGVGCCASPSLESEPRNLGWSLWRFIVSPLDSRIDRVSSRISSKILRISLWTEGISPDTVSSCAQSTGTQSGRMVRRWGKCGLSQGALAEGRQAHRTYLGEVERSERNLTLRNCRASSRIVREYADEASAAIFRP